MNSFEVKVPKLVAAANVKDIEANTSNLAKDGFEVEAIGRYAGEEIKLTAGTDFTVLNPMAGHANNANVPSIDDEKTVVKKTAKVAVAIADGKGTTVEKEYTYTNEKRVVAKAKVKTSHVSYNFSAAKGWNDIQGSFEIKDQYDVVVNSTVKPNITVSDLVDGITLEDAKKNGTNEVKIKTTDTNAKMITLKLTFNGSSYVFDQVVTFKSTN